MNRILLVSGVHFIILLLFPCSEEEDHESVRDNEDKEVALDMEDETPDKP